MITSDQALNRKYLIRQRDLANMLDMSVDAMRKLAKNDPAFAPAFKVGNQSTGSRLLCSSGCRGMD